MACNLRSAPLQDFSRCGEFRTHQFGSYYTQPEATVLLEIRVGLT